VGTSAATIAGGRAASPEGRPNACFAVEAPTLAVRRDVSRAGVTSPEAALAPSAAVVRRTAAVAV
jgi:hypothetical protein